MIRSLPFLFTLILAPLLTSSSSAAIRKPKPSQCPASTSKVLTFYDSQADPISHIKNSSYAPGWDGIDFIAPNEFNILDSKPILSRSKGGLYIGVGSERVVWGALLSNASSILVIDYDPKILWFHQINFSLLRISTSMEDYRYLRIQASPEEWARRAQQARNLLGPRERQFLEHPKTHEWWTQFVRANLNRHKRNKFEFIHKGYDTGHFEDGNEPTQILSLNYLYKPALYNKVKRLVDEGNVDLMLVDLLETDQLRRDVNSWFECQQGRKQPRTISVLDISNVATPGPTLRYNHGPKTPVPLPTIQTNFVTEVDRTVKVMSSIVDTFAPYMRDHSIFMFTTLKGKPGGGNHWNYHGYTFEALQQDKATNYTGLRNWMPDAHDYVIQLGVNYSFNKFGPLAIRPGGYKAPLLESPTQRIVRPHPDDTPTLKIQKQN